MAEKNLETEKDIHSVLRNLSTHDFKNFGLNQIAYIRSFDNEGTLNYAIHDADGEEVAVLSSRDEAIVVSRQKDLEPVIVH
ncbi:MAG: DUF1150 family protein [Alphaproteobacteria bacterium]